MEAPAEKMSKVIDGVVNGVDDFLRRKTHSPFCAFGGVVGRRFLGSGAGGDRAGLRCLRRRASLDRLRAPYTGRDAGSRRALGWEPKVGLMEMFDRMMEGMC